MFTHAASPRVNDNGYSDVSLVNIITGKVEPIAATGASESDAMFSPDGRSIAYFVSEEPVVWGGRTIVRIVQVSGGGSTELAGTPNEPGLLLGWSADGKFIYTGEAHHTLFN